MNQQIKTKINKHAFSGGQETLELHVLFKNSFYFELITGKTPF